MQRTLDLSRANLGLDRKGTASPIPRGSGPPPRIDGFVIGAPYLSESPPHGGEMHPDADEVLFLISGRMDLILEEDGVENAVELAPGEAVVVPKGVWHRVVIREPGQLLHITPGPRAEWRPVQDGRAP